MKSLIGRSLGKIREHLDRRRAEKVLNPCAPKSNARTGMFLTEKLIFDHGLFSSYEDQQEAWAKFLGHFSGIHRASDDWKLIRAPASPAQDLHRPGPWYCIYPNDVWP